MRNWTRRVCASALCILCLLALFPVRAAAAGAIDTSRNVRLTIEYRHDGKPVASVPFELYYVASVDTYANFTLAGNFTAYPVTLENLTAAEWTALAETLAAYPNVELVFGDPMWYIPFIPGDSTSATIPPDAGGTACTPGIRASSAWGLHSFPPGAGSTV